MSSRFIHDVRGRAIKTGGEVDQIQFTGPLSIQTTELYFGRTLRFRGAVNDHLALDPDVPS